MTPSTPPALRQLSAGLRALLALTVILGLVYPLVMTGAAQVLFPEHANGSLVRADGHLVGSALIGQSFTRPVTNHGAPVTGPDGVPRTEPDPAYFQSRPSAAGTGYDPLSSGASNLGPNNPGLVSIVKQRRAAVTKLDRTRPADVPPDALLASGSGLDPHISPAYADQQVDRVARARGLDPALVRDLVDQHTGRRTLAILGEPHVNVLLVNLALDRATGPPAAAQSR